ncbi:MAG: S1 family peptidase, partial [Mycobacterium gordonae]|nr:S1 family peptidase [Mycobacterium gordonae]
MKSASAVAVLAVVLGLLFLPANTASADDKVALGGGSGIVVNTGTLCTLTAIGHDKFGDLIGFTSAHCGGPGAPVAAEGAESHGQVGTMVAGND